MITAPEAAVARVKEALAAMEAALAHDETTRDLWGTLTLWKSAQVALGAATTLWAACEPGKIVNEIERDRDGTPIAIHPFGLFIPAWPGEPLVEKP